MKWAAGIDLGATRIKALACDPDGHALERRISPTQDGQHDHGQPAWAMRIKELLQAFERERGCPPAALGISAPGLAAMDGHAVECMPGRMGGLEGFDWRSFLNRPDIQVINDAHAALLGEVWQGAARGARDAILLTLGTGVGGAIWSDGRLLRGHRNRGGHLGHICLDPDGPPDITGIPGSLEDAVGEATLAQRTQGRFASTQALLAAVVQGDPLAQESWRRMIHCLGCGIASLINVCDPELVVLGGGIAEAGAALLRPLQEMLDRVEWRPGGQRAHIVRAELGEWAGAFGAAWNALQHRRLAKGDTSP